MWKILIGSIHHVNPSWFNSFGVLEAIQTYSKLLGTSQRIWFPEVTLSDFSPQKPCHFDEPRPGHFRPQDLKNEPIIHNQGSQDPKNTFPVAWEQFPTDRTRFRSILTKLKISTCQIFKNRVSDQKNFSREKSQKKSKNNQNHRKSFRDRISTCLRVLLAWMDFHIKKLWKKKFLPRDSGSV